MKAEVSTWKRGSALQSLHRRGRKRSFFIRTEVTHSSSPMSNTEEENEKAPSVYSASETTRVDLYFNETVDDPIY